MTRRGHIAANKREHLVACLASAIPKGAKLALCFDPEGDLDGAVTVADLNGRAFNIITYKENDLAFRLRLKEIESDPEVSRLPLLIRIARPDLVPLDHSTDISSIADILLKIEGFPIDLRTDAVVTHLTEPVVWPSELQTNASRISRNLRSFVEGYSRLRAAIGKARPLARYHVSAAILLGTYSNLEYSDLDLQMAYPEEVVARVFALIAHHEASAEDYGLFWDVISGASRHEKTPPLEGWKGMVHEEAIRLLVISSFLEACGVTNAPLLLSGSGWFTVPIDTLSGSIPAVVQYIKERPDDWVAMCRSVDKTTSLASALDSMEFVTKSRSVDSWLPLITEETPRCIAHALTVKYLNDQVKSSPNPKLQLPEKAPNWISSQLDTWSVAHVDSPHEDRVTGLFRFIHRVERIQSCLAIPISVPPDLDGIVKNYTSSDDCHLELLWARACKDLDALEDNQLIVRLRSFLDGLEQKIITYLEQQDALLARVVESDPNAFRKHPASSVRFLAPRARDAARAGKRFFVWLFDGMRWDTWIEVVRPVLQAAFDIEEERPLMAPIPTYTRFARSSVFAGSYPQDWKGLRGGFTYNEGELAAHSFGIKSQQEMDSDFVFLTHGDTSEAKDNFRTLKVRRFNCLVFNISDDKIHKFKGDLREINDAIRAKVDRDILPEMRRLVEANDIVVVTSDHGFVALRKDAAINAPTDQAVRRRYAYGHEELSGVTVPFSEQRGVMATTCAIGRSWYASEQNRFDRYSHGGISLAEVVVPGVVLRRSGATDSIHLEVTAQETLDVREDETVAIVVIVRNRGTRSAMVRVSISGLPPEQRSIARGKEHKFESPIKATLDLHLVDVRVEARDEDGKFRSISGGVRQIPVNVLARTDKVEFGKALDVFDDLDD